MCSSFHHRCNNTHVVSLRATILDKLFAPKDDGNLATEIVEELTLAASATKTGTRASAAQRDDIKKMVGDKTEVHTEKKLPRPLTLPPHSSIHHATMHLPCMTFPGGTAAPIQCQESGSQQTAVWGV